MTLWTKAELLTALSGELLDHKLSDDLAIDEVVIDSRKSCKSGLFLALKGEKNDAHDFLEQTVANGCCVLLVQDLEALTKVKNSNFILVKNTLDALYKLAKFSRQRSAAKIIAITGSVGKTSSKEMLKLAFAPYGKTFATAGNFNNHIGLPLSLCNFSRDCEFGIFEMGMNHLGEIEPLSRLARPHLAIITNVGPVHLEFFKNEEEIALAKSEIFAGLEPEGIALLNRDNRHFGFLEKRAANSVSFGQNPESTYHLKSFEIRSLDQAEVFLSIRDKGLYPFGIKQRDTSRAPLCGEPLPACPRDIQKNKTKISYKISTANRAIIFNSLAVAAALDLLVGDSTIGLAQLTKLENGAGRGKVSEMFFGQKKITVIDDSYNASLPSMEAGLEFARELKFALKKKRIVAALGDMLELGEKSVEVHEEVANYLLALHIDFAVLVGAKMAEMAKKLPKNSYKTFFDSAAARLEIQDLLQDGDILYIKGSRGMKMEKLI